VVTAKNGEEALQLVQEKQPSLVITDILMPRLDGFALAQRLRSDPTTRDLPIVFLSATYITPEDKDFGLELGAVRFLEKPVDTEEFLLTIGEVLAKGLPALPVPLEQSAFDRAYRERLEAKLRHKSTQISRIETLLEDLPPEQRPTFNEMLAEARFHKEQIQEELDRLYDDQQGDHQRP
jgi:CheY-like chemotaxis protein